MLDARVVDNHKGPGFLHTVVDVKNCTDYKTWPVHMAEKNITTLVQVEGEMLISIRCIIWLIRRAKDEEIKRKNIFCVDGRVRGNVYDFSSVRENE